MWQVIACALTVIACAVFFTWRARSPLAAGWSVGFCAALGFAVPWGISAGSRDETGLFAFGLLLILVGAGLGLTAVTLLTAAVRVRTLR